jgi:regulation of enolase protein 1 (concanavalin A-like superfamily)
MLLSAPPAAPTNWQTPFVSDTRVRLTWTDNSNDETGFEIIRYGDAVVVVAGTTAANVTSFDDVTLRPGTRYLYRVHAMRGTERSDDIANGYADVTTVASTASQPNAPTNVQVDGMTVNSQRLTWTDNSTDETRFDIFREVLASGRGYSEFLASVPANTVSFQDTNLRADTSYSYSVRAVGGSVYSAFSGPAYGRTWPLTAVGQWTSNYLGYPTGSPAPASGSPPNVTIQGGGDIWDGTDGCTYYCRTMEGDATVVARVASLTNTNAWAKAGVMIRSTLAASSAQVSMLLTAGANAIFEVRPTPNGSTTGTLGAWLSPPYWTKLTRVGNTFTGFISPDGVTWTQVGAANVSLPAVIYVGVAASSHASQAATAVFENLVATGHDAPPPPVIPAAPTDLKVGGITASSAHVTWLDHATNEDGFRIWRYRAGPGYELAGSVAANVTSFDDLNLQADTSYQYYVEAFKGGDRSTSSNIVPMATGGAAPAKPAAPRDLHPDSFSSTSTHLVWTDVSSDETQFILERATSSGAYASIATLPANTISYTDGTLTPQTHYAYRIRSMLGSISSEMYGGAVVDTPAGPNPPPPPPPPPPGTWTGRDIGVTGSTGSDSGVPPTVTMNAGGADIYGNADGFHSMFEAVTGDATIVAHVASLNNTHPWAKAGVMIRGTLDADSANAAMVLSPDAPCSFQNRTAKGAATNVTTGAWVNPAYWVKLSRTGDTFVGYISADGTSWTEVSRATLTLPSQVYIGLVASSHTTSAQTVASFDHVDVTGADTPPPPPPVPDWAQQSWAGAAGSYTTDPTFSITTTSGDIYDQQDSGVFVYQTWSGSGEFVARMDALGNTHPWAKAGFMLRAGLGASAGNAFVAITAGGGAILQHRPNGAAAATVTDGQDWVSGPGSWIKLVRGGGQIKAYSSPDGTNWASLGAITDDLPVDLYAGFAVSSHNSAASTTATFSGFTWPE